MDPNTLPPQVQAYFDDALLSVETPRLIHKLPAQKRSMPSKSGRTIRFSRYRKLPRAMTPLSDSGDPIPPTPVQRFEIDAEISLYGLYCAVNQRVTLNNQDPVLSAFAELLGLSMRMTEDELTKQVMLSTTSLFNCTGGANGDNPTDLSPADIDDVVGALLTNNAVMMMDNIQGENRFGTGPVRDSFIALGHTKLQKDLNNLPNFIPKWNYPREAGKDSSEWGSYQNTRWFLSSEGSVTANASALGRNVYDVFIAGMEAVACVEQDNFSSRFLYRPPVYSDPLFQNVTLGYTFAEVPVILNDLWLCRLRTTLR